MSGAQVKATIGSGPLRGVVCAGQPDHTLTLSLGTPGNRFHASRRALPLHSARKGFGKCWRLILACAMVTNFGDFFSRYRISQIKFE